MADRNEAGSQLGEETPRGTDERSDGAAASAGTGGVDTATEQDAELERDSEADGAGSSAERAARTDSEGLIGSEAGGEAGALETEPTGEGSASAARDDKSSDAYHARVVAAAGTPAGLVNGLLRELRPKQWVKNILVLAAPFSAGELWAVPTLLDAAVAFAVFSMAASGIYFINDALDVESDRAHPTKRNRPIAAGLIPLPVAYAVCALLLVGSLVVSGLVSMGLLAVMVVYVAVQLGYCFGLKHQPVIDLCIVASGFLLRAVAGGAAAGLEITQWFYIVVAFGSLFMVAGKRYAEVKLANETGAKIRKSLRAYSASYLRFVWAISAAIMIMSYSLWAYDIRQVDNSVWGIISIIPFVVGILRYAVDVDKGVAGEPEEVALKDRVLLVLFVILAGCLFLAFYL
ncbi:decaprenyl-phosphate phosphoribosyltransferase [Actinopolyspora erythraea]|uniref:Decaprenyl-phosphate phosphoribosyltransferase n=1 Tax=Actinopolyspora erythraea TaxID=414996 RepID=A0A099DBQ3_9ACTN|nr:decaprenyl-phosphate phosphoribosyltransferase [Actinopolyspora erythraea]ASU77094.1 decaprenyl-phosphate phosphoribosyltransferase [Actinopolyspora erythraea]KGI83217.1 phosphoribose diphosphate:decaprenyl-phosphate phosphoribosyltransferase [Actinopolyspora erythraea]